MSRADITIPTPDGPARAFAFTPDDGSTGPWPGAIIAMDAPAIRPALFDMGQRLADAGYFVLLPDLFWRAGPYPKLDIAKARAGDPEQVELFGRLRASTTVERQMIDVAACLDDLGSDPRVKPGKVGITGYCMGGSIALRAAGTFPDRIGAAASFHGGNMATDEATSAHLLAPRITAKVLVAGAVEDRSYDEAQNERLKTALIQAGVEADVSIWPGCRHGWVPADMPVHNPEGAERHWKELIALLDSALK
ncbi:MAG TPA: dienelactone hydrolase family protein [Phenylobacterium sp.]|nr:dienelactone hydrolase family protein [Phenylobacterium sp.]